jgi:hypothetical protein
MHAIAVPTEKRRKARDSCRKDDDTVNEDEGIKGTGGGADVE